jgi:hypothetical protein
MGTSLRIVAALREESIESIFIFTMRGSQSTARTHYSRRTIGMLFSHREAEKPAGSSKKFFMIGMPEDISRRQNRAEG